MNRNPSAVLPPAAERGARRHVQAFAALMLLAALAHGWAAWTFRYTLDTEAGVVALMARHMSEGRSAPVFVYGQLQTGSLEPAVSALFCRVFGPSGFAVCLGTAALFVLLLPIVYAWARDAGGPSAGLAAMAYLVIGPVLFFEFSGFPQGGHGAVLLLGTLVLWLASRIVLREAHDGHAPWHMFLLLGLAAGIGWWTHRLTDAALLTAACLLGLGLRRRLASWRSFSTLAGFALGSAPFWLWNALHEWEALRVRYAMPALPWRRAIRLFFGPRLTALLGVSHLAPGWRNAAYGAHATVGVLAAVALLAALLRRRRHSAVSLAAAFLFVLVSAGVYARTPYARFDTSRYLLPIVPAIAVMAGAATARLRSPRFKWAAWIPLLVLIAVQCRAALRASWRRERAHAEQRASLAEIRVFLDSSETDTVLSGNTFYALNFALDEQACFTDCRGDRYPPYTLHADLSDRVAVMGDHGNISAFLAYAGGRAAAANVWEQTFVHAFKAPDGGLSEIPPADWTFIADADGRSAEALGDRDAATTWLSARKAHVDDRVTIGFRQPATVGALRMIASGHRLPRLVRLRGETPDGQTVDLLPGTLRPTGYYWSGTRPFWAGERGRIEMRFAARLLTQLHVEFPAARRSRDWALSQVQVFQPAAPPPSEADSVDVLLDLLHRRGIRRLYADRWIANVVHAEAAGAVRTHLEPHVFPLRDVEPRLTLTPDTALLAHVRDAPLCREVLASRGIILSETAVGPWILFGVTENTPPALLGSEIGIRWIGCGCLAVNDKKWAAELVRRAHASHHRSGPSAATLGLMKQALRVHPGFDVEWFRLTRWLREAGAETEAEEWLQEALERFEPQIATPIEFANGVRFLGLSMEPRAAVAGQRLKLRYFWRCPAHVDRTDMAVFVHFEGPGGRFQDDHLFLAGQDTGYQPLPEIFIKDSSVIVPKDMPPGYYEIRVGLYRLKGDQRRIHMRSALPHEKRAAVLPVTLQVNVADRDA